MIHTSPKAKWPITANRGDVLIDRVALTPNEVASYVSALNEAADTAHQWRDAQVQLIADCGDAETDNAPGTQRSGTRA